MQIILTLVWLSMVAAESMDTSFSALRRKIFGGNLVLPERMTFIVSVRINNWHFCGGCLISQLHVLTAAHCTHYKDMIPVINDHRNKLNVMVGNHRLESRISYSVNHIHVPFNYNNKNVLSANDISVLVLNNEVVLSEHVSVIQWSSNVFPPGTKSVTIRWDSISTLENNEGAIDSFRIIEVKVVKNSICQIKYTKPAYNSHVCAQPVGNQENFSDIDGGDPLIYENQVIGVFSYIKSNTTEGPLFFTRVSELANFIKNALNAKPYVDFMKSKNKVIEYNDGKKKDYGGSSRHYAESSTYYAKSNKRHMLSKQKNKNFKGNTRKHIHALGYML